ncbi:MAG: VCBS repeat-containing protein [Deltaproteobacteria bacterium]|nr:VCBS repeat-containing protein [Deltaproteobacteria bacterium]
MNLFGMAVLVLGGALGAACSAGGNSRLPAGSGAGEGSGAHGAGNGLGGTLGTGGGLGMGGTGAGAPANVCKVPPDDEDAVVPSCVDKAPADSFGPQVQWTWTAPPADPGAMYTGSFVTPLVGNFTDDNADGAIDLCDTPDILVSAVSTMVFGGVQTLVSTGRLYLLSGDDGHLVLTFPGAIDSFVYPAFGDIDADGLPEVLAADPAGHLVAYEHDGTLKWTGDVGGYLASFASAQCTTIGLYDLDANGSVELLFGFEVFSSAGKRLWGVPGNGAEYNGQYWCVTPTAADLDGDGKLEVLFGHQTYRHDGSLYWQLPGFPPAHPHVANLDADPEPEVFVTNTNGITVVEADGKIKFGPLRPTAPNPAPNCWGKPAVVHDFDGDGQAEIAAATCTDYSVYEVQPSTVVPKWTANVQDMSGLATATAFDFLGDAVAEAIYADEQKIYVFDGVSGKISLTAERSSGTLIEYPVVADVDNDGSAEIAFVSNYPQGKSGVTLTVLRDAEERWIPARRIWNQYSYHVTNVREDGTIPQKMKKSWLLLNTFRTNSQIGTTGDCAPEPPK